MSCPFLDPETLARMPAEKREEMREIYARMKKEENDHLKINMKEADIDSMMMPEKAMMGMTGTSDGGSGAGVCPMAQTADSGGSEEPAMNF